MIRKIVLNNQKIEYELHRKKVKNLNLRIKPDGTIYVSANNKISQERIDLFLQEHSDFIFDALKNTKKLQKINPRN